MLLLTVQNSRVMTEIKRVETDVVFTARLNKVFTAIFQIMTLLTICLQKKVQCVVSSVEICSLLHREA